MSPPRRKRTEDGGLRGKVRAHDPFELIRWLALSQPDPRKALAELVQNSLDAGARTIRLTRVRVRGVPCLRVFDDGEGVIPELERSEALRYIATHIGHSRKRNLSPQERLRLMTQGQYGIGLLGFWSLGERLEMRTVVPGQPGWHLILHRDRPDYLIEPLRGRLPLDERWTEVVVIGLHKACMPVLAARRAADYLAAELRGQLLMRQVDMLYEDRMSRGRAQKLAPIRPHRFLGERLALPESWPVVGQAPVRLELYVRAAPGGGGAGGGAGTGDGTGDGSGGDGGRDEGDRLAVYSAGTLVARDFAELEALGLARPPWTDPRLIGLVDYPDFTVAPGSRRGVLADAAAEAFAAAMADVAPRVEALLAELDRRRVEELDRTMIRDLQRAFRDLLRARPSYQLPPVAREDAQRAEGGVPEPAPPGGQPGGGAPVTGADLPPPAVSPEADGGGLSPYPEPPAPEASAPAHGLALDAGTAHLFPPGPLHHVLIQPAQLRLPCGGRRRARCLPCDASGRPLDRPVEIAWTLAGPVGRLDPPAAAGIEVMVCAGEDPGRGWLRVAVSERGLAAEESAAADLTAEAEAPVEVLEVLGASRSAEGIPAPILVDDPGGAWRSRWLEERWEVNVAHRDYRAVADRPAWKLRYLAALFAKEIVLRSSGDPRLADPLEQLVEVFSFADRRLGWKGARKRPAGGRAGEDKAGGGRESGGGPTP